MSKHELHDEDSWKRDTFADCDWGMEAIIGLNRHLLKRVAEERLCGSTTLELLPWMDLVLVTVQICSRNGGY